MKNLNNKELTVEALYGLVIKARKDATGNDSDPSIIATIMGKFELTKNQQIMASNIDNFMSSYTIPMINESACIL